MSLTTRKIRVLVADDELHVRQVVAATVGSLGADVVVQAADDAECRPDCRAFALVEATIAESE